MLWSRSGRRSSRTLSVFSLGACLNGVKGAMGPHKLLKYCSILSCGNEISAKWTNLLHHFLNSDFGASLNSAFYMLTIFISLK